MPSLYIHDGTVWRKMRQLWTPAGAYEVPKRLKKLYAHDGTEWRLVFTDQWWVNIFGLAGANVHWDGSILYTAGFDGGVIKYENGVWTRLGSAGTVYAWSDVYVLGGTVFASSQSTNASRMGVYYWNGSSLVLYGSNFGGTFGIAHVHAASGVLYAANPFDSFWRWNGASWVSMGSLGASYGSPITARLTDDGTDLYVCTDQGVLRYNGSAWSTYFYTALARRTRDVCFIGGVGYVATSVGVYQAGTGIKLGTISDVRAVANINGDLYAAYVSPSAGVAKWDGSTWVALAPNPSSTSGWSKFLNYVDGKLWRTGEGGNYYWNGDLL